MTERFQELGAEVARAQDELLEDSKRRAAVRQRLERKARPAPKTSSSHWRPWAGAAGVIAAAAAAAALFWARPPDTIHYRIGNAGISNAIDVPIAATEGRTVSVAFSDDSWVRLTPGGRAHIRELTTVGAQLELEDGKATFYIRPRKGTKWSVRAGPFLVEVIGTTFDVSWNRRTESFALAVFEGEVQVSGPAIGTRQVRGGDQVDVSLRPEPTPPIPPASPPPTILPPTPKPEERVRASARKPSPVERARPPREEPKKQETTRPVEPKPAELPEATPSRETEPAIAPPPEAESSPEAEASAETPKPPTVQEPPPSSEGSAWKELMERGAYSEVLSDLSPDQVQQAIERCPQSDLVKLAAAARRNEDPRTTQIYRMIRTRFPQTDAAARAAFMLARVEFHDGSYREAAMWLETYSAEQPKGRFAREAAGRLIEAYRASGDEEAAKAAAQRYLARHPDGPHADLAREVLR